jgi:hypothetical protein
VGEALFGHHADAQAARELSGERYPGGATTGPDLDVLATRDGLDLWLYNRGATPREGGVLWLNEQYVARAPDMPVGQWVSLPLKRAVNHHGEPFPVGGLLTPDRGFPLVLAEWVERPGGERRRLLSLEQP